jgi:hypothetical protein
MASIFRVENQTSKKPARAGAPADGLHGAISEKMANFMVNKHLWAPYIRRLTVAHLEEYMLRSATQAPTLEMIVLVAFRQFYNIHRSNLLPVSLVS